MSKRTFDMGDPEPEDVHSVVDYREDGYDPEYPEGWHPYWGRTEHHGWKGYTDGGKTYLEWDELVRRFGPLHEEEA